MIHHGQETIPIPLRQKIALVALQGMDKLDHDLAPEVMIIKLPLDLDHQVLVLINRMGIEAVNTTQCPGLYQGNCLTYNILLQAMRGPNKD
jgi:hypothetical protein